MRRILVRGCRPLRNTAAQNVGSHPSRPTPFGVNAESEAQTVKQPAASSAAAQPSVGTMGPTSAPSSGSGATTSTSASTGNTHDPAQPGGEEVKENLSDGPEWSMGRLIGTALGVLGGGYVGWNLYKCGGNIHKTEAVLAQRIRRMRFHPPPGPTVAERNSHLKHEAKTDLERLLAHYFLHYDAELPKGMTRNEALDLVDELGFDEDSPSAKEFLKRGRGSIDERKRLSPCDLDDFLGLFNGLLAEASEERLADLLPQVRKLVPTSAKEAFAIEKMAKAAPMQLPKIELEDHEASDAELLQMELQSAESRQKRLLDQQKRRRLSAAEEKRLEDATKQIAELKKKVSEMVVMK